MKNVHYIGLGTLGVPFIYYPKKDKLYVVLAKENQNGYKTLPYLYVILISGILTSAIVFMSNRTAYIRMIFSLNVLQCVLISIMTIVLCRKTMINGIIKKISYEKLMEVPFEEATTGHYNSIRSHTVMSGGLVCGLYAFCIISWINRFDYYNIANEDDIILLFLIFLLFIGAGFLYSLIDPMGRIKLMCRIHKEKRRLKKEKRALRK